MSEDARFELRHGTQDQEVFDAVLAHNQYKLADKIPSDALIIDIGANIGCFAVACLLRGAGCVACFEPSPNNFKQLSRNLSDWTTQAVAFNVAVWRSDVTEEVSFSPGIGTATCCCFPTQMAEKEGRINTVSLDEIIQQSTNGGERRVQLLKIDAEYSEYPILYSCTKLDLVDEIIGETHEFHGGCALRDTYYNHPEYKNSAAEMARFLQDQGFSVTIEPESYDNQINTLFWASRPAPETADATG